MTPNPYHKQADVRQTFDFWNSQLDEIWLEQMQFIHKGKDLQEGILKAYGDLISQPDRLRTATEKDFKRLVNSWMANMKIEKSRAEVKRVKLI